MSDASSTAASVPLPHCDSCCCFAGSSISLFDTRCQRLLFDVVKSLPLSDDARSRTLDIGEMFHFGFTGWKSTWTTSRFCGQFLVALMPRGWNEAGRPKDCRSWARFYYVNSTSPRLLALRTAAVVTPQAARYLPGDVFNIEHSPTLEELDEMIGWHDSKLSAYLRTHVEALLKLVEKEAAEWTEVGVFEPVSETVP